MRGHNLNHVSPCVSQARLGTLSLPALSGGVSSGQLGCAKPIGNLGAKHTSSGRKALGPRGPQRALGLAGTSYMTDDAVPCWQLFLLVLA